MRTSKAVTKEVPAGKLRVQKVLGDDPTQSRDFTSTHMHPHTLEKRWELRAQVKCGDWVTCGGWVNCWCVADNSNGDSFVVWQCYTQTQINRTNSDIGNRKCKLWIQRAEPPQYFWLHESTRNYQPVLFLQLHDHKETHPFPFFGFNFVPQWTVIEWLLHVLPSSHAHLQCSSMTSKHVNGQINF